MKIKITKDGFIWLIIDMDIAKALWQTNKVEIYQLYDDDSESLVEDLNGVRGDCELGIEVCFINQLLESTTH